MVGLFGSYFARADLAVVGIGCDIAGAVILALSFSVKSPERMRSEVPTSVTVPTTVGHISVPFPQQLAESMARQRAEARLGLFLLVVGFVMQAAVYFVEPAGHLFTNAQKVTAGLLVLGAWVFAIVLVKTYVRWDERRTLDRMPVAPTHYVSPFGEAPPQDSG